MLGYCEKCQTVFKAQGTIQTGAGVVVHIHGLKTPCTKCGEWSKVLEGVYDFSQQGVFKLISGTPFTIDILNKLKSLAEKAIKEDSTPEKFVKEATNSNAILSFLEYCIPKNKKEFKNYLAWLLTILIPIIYDKCKNDNPSIIYNDERKIVNQPTINNYINYKAKKVAPTNKKMRIIKRIKKP